MKHTIALTGIKCYAYHGCLEEEARIGGHYIVDVSMDTDFSSAAHSDELSETIDYCDVARIVQEEMKVRSKLIEHVGQRILTRLNAELRDLHAVTLTVTKLSPPIQGDVQQVSVTFKS
jgi:dihydroneopterin aldolase